MVCKHALAAILAISGSFTHAAGTEQAVPSVQVAFVHPEKFSDPGDRPADGDSVRGGVLGDLGNHIVKRAGARLGPDLALSVAITDVDLAGSGEPRDRGVGNLRVVRDVLPPRIDLEFTLTDRSGRVVKRGERRLRDAHFTLGTAFMSSDPLRYEKALIDRWLEREFP